MHYKRLVWYFISSISFVLMLFSFMLWGFALYTHGQDGVFMVIALSCVGLFFCTQIKLSHLSIFFFQVNVAFGSDFFTPYPKLFIFKKRWLRENKLRVETLMLKDQRNLQELCLHKMSFRDTGFENIASQFVEEEIKYTQIMIARKKDLAFKLGFDESVFDDSRIESELIFQ